jgi:cerevisin
MKSFFATAASLLAICATTFAAPQTNDEGVIGNVKAPSNSSVHSGPTKEYIITWTRNETQPKGIDEYLQKLKLEGDAVKFESTNSYTRIVIMELCQAHADTMAGFTEISVVEEKATIESYAQKTMSPWGLQALSNTAGASGSPRGQDFTYSFDDTSLGAGVDIYVVDTGVRTTHAAFTGRASQGFSAFPSNVDGDGHGTHVAGTAAAAMFGVAQSANIIAVRVLGDNGAGASSDTIKGMDWVIANHEKRRTQPGFKGSIMNMSWGLKGTAQTVDETIAGAIEAGIHVSVAAGNDGKDACGSTPAHLGGGVSNVVSVGSVNIKNQVSTFSNIGTCVDIYAPGEQVISAWNQGDAIIEFLSGTSMACPHVTGVMAYLIGQDPSLSQNPAALKAKLLQTARTGAVSGNLGGSANLLLSNGVDGGITAKRLVKNYVDVSHSGLNGSPAARAAAAVANDIAIDKRFKLHSRGSQLRF